MIDLERLTELTGESGCTKRNRPYLVGWDDQNEAAYVFRPDCKCWNCQPCATRLRGRWTQRTFQGISSYIELGYEFKFVTLTSHERLYTLYQTEKVWKSAWPKLRKRVQRIYDEWFWVMIPEQHRDGRLHVHMISSAHLGQRWWKDNARECGLGWRAEEKEFKGDPNDPARAAAYAGKYMDKQLGVKSWPRYFHHIRTSQHFPDLPASENNPYEDVIWHSLSPKDVLHWLAMQDDHHHPVYYTGNGERIS